MERPPIRRQEYTRQSTTWFGGVHPPPCFGIRMSWPTFLDHIPSISIVSGSVHVVSLELVNRICVFALPSCFMEACGWTPKVGVVENSLWPWILLTKGWQVYRRIIVEYMRESERTTLSWYILIQPFCLLRPQVPTVGDPRKPGFNRFGGGTGAHRATSAKHTPCTAWKVSLTQASDTVHFAPASVDNTRGFCAPRFAFGARRALRFPCGPKRGFQSPKPGRFRAKPRTSLILCRHQSGTRHPS